MVGIQHHDDALASYLEANTIPFVKLESVPFDLEAIGWGPRAMFEGERIVAERSVGMLSANKLVGNDVGAQSH